VAWYAFSGPPLTPAEREFAAIMADWRRVHRRYEDALDRTAGNAARKKARAEFEKHKGPLAERCLRLSRSHPGSAQELAALCWAAGNALGTEAGGTARDVLENGRIVSADPAQLAWALGQIRDAPTAGILAPAVLDRVKLSPDDPLAAQLLTWVCTTTRGDEEKTDVSRTFAEAAELIASRHAGSSDIVNFCENLGLFSGSPPWAHRFETHLRTIIKQNRDRKVRCAASFALASVVQSCGEARQPEAEALYDQFIEQFDGRTNYSYSGIEQEFRNFARKALRELRSRGIGHPAPEIAGVDLEGRPMTLSEYRGKVVLLSFWATWCFPCMKLIPHERELAARLRDKPFAIVGVNCDTDEAAVKDALAKHQIHWRSFRDHATGDRPISGTWDVLGYPTLYLIDHEGVIRKRWIGSPPPADLDREVDRLVKVASLRG
jgi:thiol-disulfide isomerase/thioredoxin